MRRRATREIAIMTTNLDSQSVEERAARWLVRRESGRWNDADQAEMDAWLAEHTAHRIAYLRLEAAWRNSARLKALGARVPSGQVPPRGSWGDARFFRAEFSETPPATEVRHDPIESPSPRPPRFSSLPTTRMASLAAAALVTLTIATYFLLTYILTGDRYTTPIGGTETVHLDDGSRMILNTDTSIRVLFSPRQREIRLDRGEAFFEDTEDASRPFIVYVGDKRIRAVGTQFDVRRYTSDEIQVVVAEGRVKLTMPGNPIRVGRGSSHDPSLGSALLGSGEVARASKAEIAVHVDTPSGVEQLLSWREGYISFDDTPLSEAVVEFNRYNHRKLVIADPAVGRIKIGGNFRSTNEDAFVALLQAGFAVRAEPGSDEVILKSK